jgi:PncC family amidohydrolase
MTSTVLTNLSTQVSEEARKRHLSFSAVESCTGGMFAGCITAVPRASEYFHGGYVAYSDQMKVEVLGVDKNTIQNYGSVSENTAKEMAKRCLEKTNSNISLAITGVAGPDGGTDTKPVGTVCFAIAWLDEDKSKEDEKERNSIGYKKEVMMTECHTFRFDGDREKVRNSACERGLQLVLRKIKLMK